MCAFDAIHDQQEASLAALKGIHWMLASGGLFSMVILKPVPIIGRTWTIPWALFCIP
ncbi:MAG: hypothetical protein R2860_04595 [Desulfobacterales bacterium]